MTDLEKFRELYVSLGFDLKINSNPIENRQYIVLQEGFYNYEVEGTTKGFDGYNGFYSEIEFDMEGKFISQGFWE